MWRGILLGCTVTCMQHRKALLFYLQQKVKNHYTLRVHGKKLWLDLGVRSPIDPSYRHLQSGWRLTDTATFHSRQLPYKVNTKRLFIFRQYIKLHDVKLRSHLTYSVSEETRLCSSAATEHLKRPTVHGSEVFLDKHLDQTLELERTEQSMTQAVSQKPGLRSTLYHFSLQ